jgi:predicted Zn-dependent protease
MPFEEIMRAFKSVLVLLLLSAPAPVFYHCGTLSSVGARFVSDSQEVAMGRQFHKEILADPSFPLYTDKENHNPRLVSYIDSLGRLLARAQNDRSDIDYVFTVIDNDTTVNAFAVPGGYIYIYTGLIRGVRNEAELAGVMGHELAHITMRHGVQLMLQQRGYDLALDIIVGDSSLARGLLDVAGGLTFLKYKRVNEEEADSLAVAYTSAAGLNPLGMKTFLELLAQDESQVWELFSTHPPSTERAEEVERIAESHFEQDLNRSLGGAIPNP